MVLRAESSPYNHGRMPAVGWLRLLTFHTDDLPSLRCSLQPYRFDDAPPYYALSYHWGDSKETVSLSCDEGSIAVSRSLYQALLRLRTLKREGGISHFWVDQMCINQTDMKERTDQVLLMKNIYLQSARTLIWLALSNHQNGANIFDLFSKLERSRRESKAVGPISEEEIRSLDLPTYDSPTWSDIAELLANPWFQRTWVVQEAALSTIDPLILCGDQEIEFNAFLDTVRWVEDRFSIHLATDITLPATPVLIDRIRKHSHETTGERHPWKLEAILRMANHLQSTDPRDRIYALLGLTTSGGSEPATQDTLRPDYARDVVELYSTVTRLCIQQSQRLGILSSGGVNLERDSAFPSWVPRWDCPRRSDVLLGGPNKLVSYVDEESQVDMYHLYPYKASLYESPMIRESEDPRELILGGVYIDSIAWSSEVQARVSPKEMAQAIRQLWEMCLERLEIPVDPDNQRLHDSASSFSMAIASGLDFRDPGIFRQDDANRNFWALLTSCYDKNASAFEKNRRAVDVYRSLGAGGDPLDMVTHLPGRKFFITRDGRAGNGAATLQTGDEIFVLLGGAMPYILRPRGPRHEMVGEAFVHGLMEGGTVIKLYAGDVEGQWVTLR